MFMGCASRDALTERIHMAPRVDFVLKGGKAPVDIAKEKDIQNLK